MTRSFHQRTVSFLGSPRFPIWVVLLALGLGLPSLWAPLIADDYIHRIRLSAEHHFAGFNVPPYDLFTFGSGEPEQRRQLMEEGAFAWWTAKGFKMAFWRPLSTATHVLDHHLWPDSAIAMHAHGLLWFGVLLLALAVLYGRFHPPWIAGLALCLYAFDDARGMVLAFVANRNALIAAVFAVGALIAYDRWRRDDWVPGKLLAPGLYTIALLGGESALAITGYLLGYALFLDRDSSFRRFVPLAPFGLITIVWALLYRSMGYGTHGSGIYMHPADEPVRFALALLERAPVLLLGQFAGPPSDLWLGYPPQVATGVYAFALLFIALFLRLLWPQLRAHPECRFWLFGSLIALIPVCATFPSDRLLVFVGIGAMGLVASFLASVFDRGATSRDARPPVSRRVAALLLVSIHLFLAPLLLPLRALTTLPLAAVVEGVNRSLPSGEALRERTLVVVSAPADGVVAYVPIQRAALDLPRPKRLRLLATGKADVQLTRLDAHTLRVRPAAGFIASEVERMVRSRSIPMSVGEQVELTDMSVEVTAVTVDGRPAEAEFRFDRPLEDPTWLWVRWDRSAFVPWQPPPIGASDTVPGGDLSEALFGSR